ncbi:pyridoxal 5'-phosphate synthase [Isoptericola sediminis]|uniref:Pyridoxal 5'-phosphate synthase n=1 Tax=Isoptericola sediminis TaxID=2733572 RepID=A0A849KI91_9MICO|nr:pyridoxal 5'-phosphate synthase [Isoptericola sediminis]
MTSFRARLRDLQVLPDGLSGWELTDISVLPGTPHELFETWFDEAAAAGLHAPHAMTLSTAGADGTVAARTVLLTDLSSAGWWFAGHATSPKGRDLAANPHAALTFLWQGVGRQVRVTGAVTSHPEAGAADFRSRSAGSRATALVDHQSEVLDDLADHREAWSAALAEVRADPELVVPTWTAWCLAPTTVEFWRSGGGTGQTRVRYRRGGQEEAWTTELLWP